MNTGMNIAPAGIDMPPVAGLELAGGLSGG